MFENKKLRIQTVFSTSMKKIKENKKKNKSQKIEKVFANRGKL